MPFDWPKNAEEVTERMILQWTGLKGPQRTLNKTYGDGNWGREEVINYILERGRRARNQKDYGKKKNRLQTGIYQKDVDALVSDYLKHFENVTPNDMRVIQQMSEIEVILDGIHKERVSRSNGSLTIDDKKKLAEMELKYSAEFRQLQSALGIDRASRETQVDTANEVARFVEGAQKLLEEQAVRIRCPHCPPEVEVNQGYVLFHFKGEVEWKWENTCPRCGGKVELGR